VSVGFDIRPALRVACGGVHTFYSSKDKAALGIGIKLVGTSDDPLAARAAGRYGFTPPRTVGGDESLAAACTSTRGGRVTHNSATAAATSVRMRSTSSANSSCRC